jgi:hypothetical protein
MAQRNRLYPQYVCKAIALDVTRLCRITPGLEWQWVQDYYSPSLLDDGRELERRYGTETAERIMSRLDVELKHIRTRFNLNPPSELDAYRARNGLPPTRRR